MTVISLKYFSAGQDRKRFEIFLWMTFENLVGGPYGDWYLDPKRHFWKSTAERDLGQFLLFWQLGVNHDRPCNLHSSTEKLLWGNSFQCKSDILVRRENGNWERRGEKLFFEAYKHFCLCMFETSDICLHIYLTKARLWGLTLHFI